MGYNRIHGTGRLLFPDQSLSSLNSKTHASCRSGLPGEAVNITHYQAGFEGLKKKMLIAAALRCLRIISDKPQLVDSMVQFVAYSHFIIF